MGTLRTLADYTQEPAEILRGMNRRLCGRVRDGFATCVVLRIKPNGEATIANAGHLSPFRDGEELPLSGALPLGLSAEATYEELLFRLQEGETLTLYTDGIVEARSATGELYGFERVQKLAQESKSAEQIVEAACTFGQQDDITVLSIRRLAAAEEPAKARAEPNRADRNGIKGKETANPTARRCSALHYATLRISPRSWWRWQNSPAATAEKWAATQILENLQPSLRDSIMLVIYPGLASWAEFSQTCPN